ncbi:MAG: CGNR zinc finger domain-containing protein [Longimicrobiaceae bacterium]
MESKFSYDAAFWTDGFKVIGGNPALDFVNTLSERRGDEPVERVRSYTDLVEASKRIGVLTEDQAQAMLDAARDAPEAAETVRAEAVALRELLYRVFSAVANGRAPSAEELASLNSALSNVLVHLGVGCDDTETAFTWVWEESAVALDRMLWPMVRAAADLLVSDRLDRVGECAGDDCGWLFLDLSRNRSRRWCDMSDCGNRAKMRRFMQRHRSSRH